VARHIQQQAEQEQERELAELQAELLELQLLYEQHEVAEEEVIRKEAQLLERVGALAGAQAGGERE
jgi:hypothetical protein